MASLGHDEELHLLTVEQFQRMFDTGVLTEDDKVELLNGLLVEKVGENPPHHAVVMRLNRFLSRALDDDLALSTAGPIPIRPWSQPEPDFAIVDAADVTFHAHPERTHLVIEVADSSLRKDQITKAEIYGKAGFPEYWIVDVKAAAVHVHRRPSPVGYRHVETVRPPERLVPFDIELALPPLDLAVLFAPGPSQP